MAFDPNKIVQELRSIDLSEIRADNIGRWPLVVRIAACCIAFVAVLVAFYLVKVSEQGANLERLQREEQQLREEYKKKAYDAANLEAYREQMVQLEKRLNDLINQLPSDTEVPGLLEDVTAVGQGSGMQIESINLQDEKVYDYYVELPISIEAKGGYHDFAGFVSGVAGLSRIVTLHDFSIEASEKSEGLLSLQIIAKTYRYKTENDVAEAGGSRGKKK